MKLTENTIGDICILAGLALVTTGAYLIYHPAAFIVGGLSLFAVGYGLIKPHIKG